MKKSILSKMDHKAIDDYIAGKLSSTHADLRDKIGKYYLELVKDMLAIETLIDHDSYLNLALKPIRHHSLRKVYATMQDSNQTTRVEE